MSGSLPPPISDTRTNIAVTAVVPRLSGLGTSIGRDAYTTPMPSLIATDRSTLSQQIMEAITVNRERSPSFYAGRPPSTPMPAACHAPMPRSSGPTRHTPARKEQLAVETGYRGWLSDDWVISPADHTSAGRSRDSTTSSQTRRGRLAEKNSLERALLDSSTKSLEAPHAPSGAGRSAATSTAARRPRAPCRPPRAPAKLTPPAASTARFSSTDSTSDPTVIPGSDVPRKRSAYMIDISSTPPPGDIASAAKPTGCICGASAGVSDVGGQGNGEASNTIGDLLSTALNSPSMSAPATETSPLDYARLLEENKALKAQLATRTSELSITKAELSSSKAIVTGGSELAAAQKEITVLQGEMVRCKEGAAETADQLKAEQREFRETKTREQILLDSVVQAMGVLQVAKDTHEACQ